LLKIELIEYSTVIPTIEGWTLLATLIPVSDKLDKETKSRSSEDSEFKKSEREKLKNYKQGDYILFSGECTDWGNWLECEVIE